MDLHCDATQTDLFEPLLLLGKFLGLNRSSATVFAVLYSVETPLTVEDLVEQSGLSKSAISLALRELMQYGAVQERMILGERSRHFAAFPDLEQVALDMVLARLRLPLAELKAKLSHSQPISDDARCGQIQSLLDRFEHLLDGAQSQATR